MTRLIRNTSAVALHGALNAISTDTNFLMLASLVNQAKHRFFPRLFRNLNVPTNRYPLSIVSFEYLTYPNGKPTANAKENLDIFKFAKLIRDDTLFKLFGQYQLAYECVSTLTVNRNIQQQVKYDQGEHRILATWEVFMGSKSG